MTIASAPHESVGSKSLVAARTRACCAGKGFHWRKLGLRPSHPREKLQEDVPIFFGQAEAHRYFAVGAGPVFLDDESSAIERHAVQHQTPAFLIKPVPQ